MKNTDKNVSRTYYIIRMHDNKAEVIATASQAEVESGKITFATDKFSTYALAYADVTVKPDDGNKGNETVTKPDDGNKNEATAPDTATADNTSETSDETVTSGDNNRTAMWIILAFIGISGIVVMTGKKKNLVEKK